MNTGKTLRLTLLLAAALLLPALTCAANAQELSAKDRRLHVAVLGFEFNEAAAKDALSDGADVNAVNGAMGGETMLISAIKSFKEPKVVKFLLDNGADPNVKDEGGRTALSWARQYDIGRNRDGREILKLLEGGAPAAANAGQLRAAAGRAGAGAAPAPAAQPAPRETIPGRTATAAAQPRQQQRRGVGAPTDNEIKAALEKSFTTAYQNHFFGVKNLVTFEWVGPITIGTPETRGRIPTRCYPAKLNVKVTAEDPRDGNRSTVARGTEANIGGFAKTEIFCFSRNGFGEWGYVTYEP